MKTFEEIFDFLSIETEKLEQERNDINSGEFALIDKLSMMNVLDGKQQMMLKILNFLNS